jgi:hypothetical protein
MQNRCVLATVLLAFRQLTRIGKLCACKMRDQIFNLDDAHPIGT